MVTISDYKLLLKEEDVGFDARKEFSHVEDNHNAHNHNDPTDEQDLSTIENRRPSKRNLDNTVEPSASDQPAVSVLSQHVAKKTKVVVHKPTRKPSIAGCVVSKRKFNADDENPSQTTTAPKSKSSTKKMKAQQTLGDISNKLAAHVPNKSKVK
jgi:hypothetical protein